MVFAALGLSFIAVLLYILMKIQRIRHVQLLLGLLAFVCAIASSVLYYLM